MSMRHDSQKAEYGLTGMNGMEGMGWENGACVSCVNLHDHGGYFSLIMSPYGGERSKLFEEANEVDGQLFKKHKKEGGYCAPLTAYSRRRAR